MRKYLARLAAAPSLRPSSTAPAPTGRPFPWSHVGNSPACGSSTPPLYSDEEEKRRARGAPGASDMLQWSERRAPEPREQGQERRLHFPHAQNPSVLSKPLIVFL